MGGGGEIKANKMLKFCGVSSLIYTCYGTSILSSLSPSPPLPLPGWGWESGVGSGWHEMGGGGGEIKANKMLNFCSVFSLIYTFYDTAIFGSLSLPTSPPLPPTAHPTSSMVNRTAVRHFVPASVHRVPLGPIQEIALSASASHRPNSAETSACRRHKMSRGASNRISSSAGKMKRTDAKTNGEAIMSINVCRCSPVAAKATRWPRQTLC